VFSARHENRFAAFVAREPADLMRNCSIIEHDPKLCMLSICVLLRDKSVGVFAMRTIDVKHDGMGKFRRIAGFGVAEQKAAAQQQLWDKQWQRRQELERKLFAGPNGDALRALKKIQADEQNEDAGHEIVSLTSILLGALRARLSVDWAQFNDRGAFAEPPPAAPAPLQIAREPRKSEFMPPPPRSLSELLHASRRRRQKEAGAKNFKNAHDEWQVAVRWKSREHEAATEKYRAALAGWEARRSAFQATQAKAKARLDSLHRRYAAKDADAVIAYGDLVLLSADRPDGFPKDWRIDFSDGVMTVDYELPSTEAMPGVKAVKYAALREAFDTVELPERERDQLYAEAIYQTCLMVLHLLFASDEADAIKSIAFNGWVNFIDQAKPARACIMAVQTTKAAFRRIDLKSVDPQACFKALNGVASAKLAAMTAAG
jgi:restriction system protein